MLENSDAANFNFLEEFMNEVRDRKGSTVTRCLDAEVEDLGGDEMNEDVTRDIHVHSIDDKDGNNDTGNGE